MFLSESAWPDFLKVSSADQPATSIQYMILTHKET